MGEVVACDGYDACGNSGYLGLPSLAVSVSREGGVEDIMPVAAKTHVV